MLGSWRDAGSHGLGNYDNNVLKKGKMLRPVTPLYYYGIFDGGKRQSYTYLGIL